jgi:hypothetical protein
MAKRKLSLTVTLNTLEIMIKYTLISNILNRTCEMTKKTIDTSKRWYQIRPPPVFAQNRNMGNIMEKSNWQIRWMGNMVMGKCESRLQKYFHTQTNCKGFQGGYARLCLHMQWTSLENVQIFKSRFQNIFSPTYSTICQQRI